MFRPAVTSMPSFVPHGAWTVDPERSSARFRVKHLVFATVEGSFRELAGTVSADGRHLRAEGSVQVASIDTGIVERDARLRGAGFFDTERHPQITFHAARAERQRFGAWSVRGELTIMGATAPFTFAATVADGERGPRVMAHGALSRRELGLDWPGLLHSGRAVVGDRVDIELVLELR